MKTYTDSGSGGGGIPEEEEEEEATVPMDMVWEERRKSSAAGGPEFIPISVLGAKENLADVGVEGSGLGCGPARCGRLSLWPRS